MLVPLAQCYATPKAAWDAVYGPKRAATFVRALFVFRPEACPIHNPPPLVKVVTW
jgi:hypothetical protein